MAKIVIPRRVIKVANRLFDFCDSSSLHIGVNVSYKGRIYHVNVSASHCFIDVFFHEPSNESVSKLIEEVSLPL